MTKSREGKPQMKIKNNTHTHIHTYIHTYIHIHTHMHACTHVRMHTHTHTLNGSHIHTTVMQFCPFPRMSVVERLHCMVHHCTEPFIIVLLSSWYDLNNVKRDSKHSDKIRRLIMKYFLRSFSPFRWFKKGSCQFLAKECAQYWLTT